MPLCIQSRVSGCPCAAHRLCRLVLMVGKGEVGAAAVDLEIEAQQLLSHGRAFDVPGRDVRVPRGVPGGVLTRLLRLSIARSSTGSRLRSERLLALALVEILIGGVRCDSSP